MKKLLFVRKSNLQVGGVEKQMLRIAIWLRDQNMVLSALATDDISGELARLFLKNGFEVFHCDLNSKFYLFTASTQLSRIIREHNFTFLQAHMFRESIVCRKVKFLNPKIIHVFRIETYIDCSSISNLKKYLYHKLAFITGNAVDYYFANGNLVANELIQRSGLSPQKVEIVFNGVEQFDKPDLYPLKIDDDGYLTIAMVANFVRGKGHELLFEVIAKLKEKNIKIRVVLFGDDMGGINTGGKSYKQELIDLVKSLNIQDHVVFSGYSHDLAHDLEPFRIVVLPSYSEGTPNTILEAMSARKLVISSNAGELPHIIENGVSGFIHEIGDTAGLVAIFEKIVNEPFEKLEPIRENGLKRWQSVFSLNGMMNQMVEIYSKH